MVLYPVNLAQQQRQPGALRRQWAHEFDSETVTTLAKANCPYASSYGVDHEPREKGSRQRLAIIADILAYEHDLLIEWS